MKGRFTPIRLASLFPPVICVFNAEEGPHCPERGFDERELAPTHLLRIRDHPWHPRFNEFSPRNPALPRLESGRLVPVFPLTMIAPETRSLLEEIKKRSGQLWRFL
jgi:hypothetical protein